VGEAVWHPAITRRLQQANLSTRLGKRF
jgi:hypothetical protein